MGEAHFIRPRWY